MTKLIVGQDAAHTQAHNSFQDALKSIIEVPLSNIRPTLLIVPTTSKFETSIGEVTCCPVLQYDLGDVQGMHRHLMSSLKEVSSLPTSVQQFKSFRQPAFTLASRKWRISLYEFCDPLWNCTGSGLNLFVLVCGSQNASDC